MMRPLPSFGSLALVALLTATPALCQESTEARAQSLFDRGRSLLRNGKVGEACDLLQQSYDLEPVSGTLLNLALCHDMQGRIATAWREYTIVLQQSDLDGNRARYAIAERQLNEIAPKLTRARLVFQEPSPEIQITLDGSRLSAYELTRPVALDPGVHLFGAEAPGKRPVSVRVEASLRGELLSVNIPAMEALPFQPPAPPSQHPAPPVAARSATIGYSLIGVGFAGFVTAGYMGMRAKSSWDDRNEHCPGSRCDAHAVDSYNDAKAFATYADIGLGVGLAAFAVGTYWLITGSTDSPPKSALLVAPSCAAQSAGVGLVGAF